MSTGILLAAEVDKGLKPAAWLMIGWLAARELCKHISAPPKIYLALENAGTLFKLCFMYKSIFCKPKYVMYRFTDLSFYYCSTEISQMWHL